LKEIISNPTEPATIARILLAMSFGWSAGDIATTIALCIKVGKALRESGGSTTEYQDVVKFVDRLGKTFSTIQQILQNNPNLRWEQELIEQGKLLKASINRFEGKFAKYANSLATESTRSKVQRIPREIQLAFSDDIHALRLEVSQPQAVLDTFITLQTL
jgi:hypothetical protein